MTDQQKTINVDAATMNGLINQRLAKLTSPTKGQACALVLRPGEEPSQEGYLSFSQVAHFLTNNERGIKSSAHARLPRAMISLQANLPGDYESERKMPLAIDPELLFSYKLFLSAAQYTLVWSIKTMGEEALLDTTKFFEAFGSADKPYGKIAKACAEERFFPKVNTKNFADKDLLRQCYWIVLELLEGKKLTEEEKVSLRAFVSLVERRDFAKALDFPLVKGTLDSKQSAMVKGYTLAAMFVEDREEPGQTIFDTIRRHEPLEDECLLHMFFWFGFFYPKALYYQGLPAVSGLFLYAEHFALSSVGIGENNTSTAQSRLEAAKRALQQRPPGPGDVLQEYYAHLCPETKDLPALELKHRGPKPKNLGGSFLWAHEENTIKLAKKIGWVGLRRKKPFQRQLLFLTDELDSKALQENLEALANKQELDRLLLLLVVPDIASSITTEQVRKVMTKAEAHSVQRGYYLSAVIMRRGKPQDIYKTIAFGRKFFTMRVLHGEGHFVAQLHEPLEELHMAHLMRCFWNVQVYQPTMHYMFYNIN